MAIKNNKKLNLILLILTFSIAILLYNFFRSYIEKELNTPNFYNGIIIEGTDVGGKSKDGATALIYEKLKKEQKEMILTVSCEGKNETLKGIDLVYDFDVKKAVDSAYNYAREGNLFARYFALLKVKNDENKFTVEATLDEENLAKNVNVIMYKLDDMELEAHVKKFNPNSENMFEYAEGKDGYKLDKNEVIQQIKQQALTRRSGEINLQKHEYKNTTTIADVQKRTQLLGEFKTTSTNSENGNQNMKLSMNAVNGKIINPGETFSFNKIVGDSNDPNRGFLPGASILNGDIVMSYGGGICQAATTIYGAAIRADMTIIERRNHRFKSSYVPYGLDAAIDYNNIDLKFRNDLFYPIYIKAVMADKELVCQIFGAKNEKFDKIEVNSWVINEEETIKAEAERVYYKNEKIIDKKRLPSSVYKFKQSVST